ncbi:MAG: phosphoribosylformylglycinamidine synthase subunit PurQ [Candidatus Dadabacteria bacterium]
MYRFAVIVFPGSNCDHDCYHAVKHVLGEGCEFVWHEEGDLSGFDAVIVPGGFSYGDYLRTGSIASLSPVMKAVADFASRGGPVIGICNGFQILVEAGLLPGALIRNSSLRFVCKWVDIRVERNDTPFTCNLEVGDVLRIPVAHGEGNYFTTEAGLRELKDESRVVFRYVTPEGEATAEANPNGSIDNIAGICNEEGNVLGLMPHPERCAEELLGGEDGKLIFESILTWLGSRHDRRERAEIPAMKADA